MAMRAHRTNATTLDTPATAFSDVEVDLSSFPTGDGKPMAENFVNQIQMIGLQDASRQLLESQGRPRAAIGGNQFLYYNPHNRRDNLSPDVYIALDVEPGARNVWFTWVEGKTPDIVFEITSPSTQQKDLSREPRGKLTLYGRLGVREYYVYDPAFEGAMQPRLHAFALQGEGDEMQLEEAALLEGGGAWSPLLRAELRPVETPGTEWEPTGVYLRVIDPVTDAPIRVGEEIKQDYRASRAQVAALQERLDQVEQAFQERLTRIERMFEERLAASERARLDAEDRAR